MAVWLPNGDMENEMRDEYNCNGKCIFCDTVYSYEHIREENWDGTHDSWDRWIKDCSCGRNLGYDKYHKIKIDDLNVNELKEFLRYHKIKGYSKLNKKQLIESVKSVLDEMDKYRPSYSKTSEYIE